MGVLPILNWNQKTFKRNLFSKTFSGHFFYSFRMKKIFRQTFIFIKTFSEHFDVFFIIYYFFLIWWIWRLTWSSASLGLWPRNLRILPTSLSNRSIKLYANPSRAGSAGLSGRISGVRKEKAELSGISGKACWIIRQEKKQIRPNSTNKSVRY